jgi:hypothetical protein
MYSNEDEMSLNVRISKWTHSAPTGEVYTSACLQAREPVRSQELQGADSCCVEIPSTTRPWMGRTSHEAVPRPVTEA